MPAMSCACAYEQSRAALHFLATCYNLYLPDSSIVSTAIEAGIVFCVAVAEMTFFNWLLPHTTIGTAELLEGETLQVALQVTDICASALIVLIVTFILRQTAASRHDTPPFTSMAVNMLTMSLAFMIAVSTKILPIISVGQGEFVVVYLHTDYHVLYLGLLQFSVAAALPELPHLTALLRTIVAWTVLCTGMNAVRRLWGGSHLILSLIQALGNLLLLTAFVVLVRRVSSLPRQAASSLSIMQALSTLAALAVPLLSWQGFHVVSVLTLELALAVVGGVATPLFMASVMGVETRLIAAVTQQRAQAASWHNFINVLSHEARGPTNCIMLGVQELQRQVESDETLHTAGSLSPDFETENTGATQTMPNDPPEALPGSSQSRSSQTYSELSARASALPEHRRRALAEGVQLRPTTTEHLHETLASSLEACVTLRGIFDGVLLNAKREVQAAMVQPGKFDVANFLNPTLRTMRMALRAQNVRLELKIDSSLASELGVKSTGGSRFFRNTLEEHCHPDSPPESGDLASAMEERPPMWCVGDEKQLVSVVQNLLSNASKYSPADSVVKVRIYAYRPGLADMTLAKTLRAALNSTASSEHTSTTRHGASPTGNDSGADQDAIVPPRWLCCRAPRAVMPSTLAAELEARPEEAWPPDQPSDGLMLAVEVQDFGKGLTQQEQEAVFHKFATTSSGATQRAKAQGSTGLGLHLARTIAQAHGGDVVVHSAEPGKGCTFKAFVMLAKWRGSEAVSLAGPSQSTLSLARSGTSAVVSGSLSSLDDQQLSKRAALVDTARLPKQLRHVDAMVVDDSRSIRRIMQLILRRHVANVAEASDGAVALRKMQQHTAHGRELHVIIMDKHMRPMDGVATAGALRRLGWTGLLIGLTGDLDPAAKQAFLDAGADAVLMKPVGADQLLGEIHRWLSKSAET